MSFDLKANLIEVGCPNDRADQCANLANQAVEECLRHHRANSKTPNKRRVLQKIRKLRKAYSDLTIDLDGEMALAIIRMMPEWSIVSIDSRIADLDRAVRNTNRFMKNPVGPPKGARKSPGYDWLLLRLWALADTYGFKWTAKKNRATAQAEGTFVKFIRGIESGWPLPDGFMPASDSTLLKGIERARARLS